jgi:hypothetical protein
MPVLNKLTRFRIKTFQATGQIADPDNTCTIYCYTFDPVTTTNA